MKKVSLYLIKVVTIILLGVVVIALASCSNSNKTELKKFTDERAMIETYLARFDSLDYDIFSNQKWDLLNVSHADDIVVYWPDGHSTTGIEKHIEDLKAMFVFAPDTKIEEHPIRFGSGEWTCVTGVMSGTFSKPMPIGNGKIIPPTGKKFSVPMCTVGHWKNSKMIEEYLFWDNGEFMKQIGLAK